MCLSSAKAGPYNMALAILEVRLVTVTSARTSGPLEWILQASANGAGRESPQPPSRGRRRPRQANSVLPFTVSAYPTDAQGTIRASSLIL